MTREEIINQGRPIEPNCFETDREEQWYNVGLYDGASANQWHELTDRSVTMPNGVDVLVRFEDGTIRRYEEDLPELLVTHWCEIPKFEINK